MNAVATDFDQPGCPSGLATPNDTAVIDPTSFVQHGDETSFLTLAVFGAKCGGCIVKMEGALKALPGVTDARLNLSTGRLTIGWRTGALAPIRITETVDGLGYRAAPYDADLAAKEDDDDGKRLLRALAVAGFATANIMLLSISVWAGGGEMGGATRSLMHWASAVIAIPAALYAGRPFFDSALKALRAGRANMDVPISLAVILSLMISVVEFFAHGEHLYFDAAIMLLFFLLIGRYLDHRLRLKARAAARDLLALQTITANRLSADGKLEAVSAKLIRPGDLLHIANGDRMPVDGEIIDGRSSFDLSLVTGESAPAVLSKGDVAHAGIVNVGSPVCVRASKTVDDSLVAELARLIENGEQTKSRYVRLADKAASVYVPVVHSLALATFLGWFFVADASFRISAMNAIAVLIITCPCALGLAAPAVQVVATGRLFQKGVLVKSGDALERLAGVDGMLFDKTGTLTTGRPSLQNRADIDPGIFQQAAALARVSRHPLSRALVDAAGPGAPVDGAVDKPGEGVEALTGAGVLRFGSAAFVGADASDDAALEAWFRIGDAEPVRFVFTETIRGDARTAIAALKKRGLEIEMMSGDRAPAAAAVADMLGIDRWRAPMTPADKVDRLNEFAKTGRRIAMVGDGLNDAPSLAGAHASLAPGAAADASQAAADFVFQGDRLAPVVLAYDVACAARSRVLQNFGFAAFYNFCAIPLAALGHVTPLIAAIAMSGSSIIVTLNALRRYDSDARVITEEPVAGNMVEAAA